MLPNENCVDTKHLIPGFLHTFKIRDAIYYRISLPSDNHLYMFLQINFKWDKYYTKLINEITAMSTGK